MTLQLRIAELITAVSEDIKALEDGQVGDATALNAHAVDTTDIHGIANTALLETQAGAQAKVDAAIAALMGGATPATLDTLDELAQALGDNPDFATTIATALGNATTALASHEADTTAIHGIANTALLETIAGAQAKADAAQAAAIAASGVMWSTGSGAPAGGLGVVGNFYLDSVTGNYYSKTGASTWTLQGSIKGPIGTTGATGSTGSAGAAGAAGTPGSVWFTGSGAPAGGTGVVGNFYLNSTNGDYYSKTGVSTWTLQGNLKGATGSTGSTGSTGTTGSTGSAGAAGAAGAVWFTGSGAPAGGTGVVGDFYLNSANGDYYSKTGVSTWTLQGNIKGATGATGSAGAAGSTGATGAAGSSYLAGTTPDGTTDNTSVIQAALTAAAGTATTASGVVNLGPGFFVAGPLTVPHGVTFKGTGPRSTTLILKGSSSTATALIKNAQYATMCSVSDMRLDGNYANQAAAVQKGLVFDAGGSDTQGAGNLEYTDGRCQAHNLVVQNFTGDAVTLTGRGACQISDIQAWNNKGHGFYLGIDSEIMNCDAGNSGKNGFHIVGNPQLSNCKSWFSGWFSGAQQTANFTAGADYGNGFHWESSTSGCVNTSLIAQDNARAGFYLDGASRVVVNGWTSDTNNNNTFAGPTTFCNVEVTNSYDSRMEGGFSFDRNANARRPRFGATILTGSSNIVLAYSVQGFTNGNVDALDSAAVTYGNTIKIGNCNGSGDQSYAATVTPDNVSAGTIRIGTLTGNITIAAPKIKQSSALRLIFKQNATGSKTVTWNAVYNTTWQPASAANAWSSITFIWNSSDGQWDVLATAGVAG